MYSKCRDQSEIILLRFKKLPTEKIYYGLDHGEWLDKNRDAAIAVLKMRGKDVSKYIKTETESMLVTEHVRKRLTSTVERVLNNGTKLEIERLYELTKNIDDFGKLPMETAEYILKELSADGRSEENRIQSRYLRRQWKSLVKREEHKIDATEKALLAPIISNSRMSIKAKVLKLLSMGYTFHQIAQCGFADAGYVRKIVITNKNV